MLINTTKKLIPSQLKLSLKLLQRYHIDWSSQHLRRFVNFQQLNNKEKTVFQSRVSISQAIKKTQHSENKKHNLNLAIARIQDVVIQPDEIFSFWHLVGKPDKAKGYREGRSLVANQLKAEVGGGLCQLSGLLYLLSLKAGFPTLERHPHSHDIYTELTRFAPLGSDATVVYGYKDFRFQNHLSFPVCFRFSVQEKEISAMLCSPQPISEYRVEFKVEELKGGVKVDTIRFGLQTNTFEVVTSTNYEKFV